MSDAGSNGRCDSGSTYSFLDMVCKVINIVLVECVEPSFNEINPLVKAGLKFSLISLPAG